MSATSGITIHDDLQSAFATAQSDASVRFFKLSIRNESIVLDHTVCAQGDLFGDLDQLQDILEDHVPAYVLARLDDLPTQWLAISYVPDTAKVRDKMLYASTRNSLTKSLGSASFSDALFANHKSDLTSTAYAAHRRHLAAPKPLSVREREMEDVRAATIASSTEGSAARRNHIGGAGVHINWPETVSAAIRRLASEETDRLVVLGIDTATETLVLSAESECAIGEVGSLLPSLTPAYAFLSWSHDDRQDIVFIYSCPSSSPIKHRMIYSSGASSVLAIAKDNGVTVVRKVETSDPKEVNEAFIRGELGLNNLSSGDDKKPFARPRGPARRQR